MSVAAGPIKGGFGLERQTDRIEGIRIYQTDILNEMAKSDYRIRLSHSDITDCDISTDAHQDLHQDFNLYQI